MSAKDREEIEKSVNDIMSSRKGVVKPIYPSNFQEKIYTKEAQYEHDQVVKKK